MKFSEYYSLSASEVCAIIKTESNFHADARSKKGAIGLMQIMPETADWIAGELQYDSFSREDLFDAETNIRFGCFYLSYLHKRFRENWQVFAAYNAGETRVCLWLEEGITEDTIPYRETRIYVRKVNEAIKIYQRKKITKNH